MKSKIAAVVAALLAAAGLWWWWKSGWPVDWLDWLSKRGFLGPLATLLGAGVTMTALLLAYVQYRSSRWKMRARLLARRRYTVGPDVVVDVSKTKRSGVRRMRIGHLLVTQRSIVQGNPVRVKGKPVVDQKEVVFDFIELQVSNVGRDVLRFPLPSLVGPHGSRLTVMPVSILENHKELSPVAEKIFALEGGETVSFYYSSLDVTAAVANPTQEEPKKPKKPKTRKVKFSLTLNHGREVFLSRKYSWYLEPSQTALFAKVSGEPDGALALALTVVEMAYPKVPMDLARKIKVAQHLIEYGKREAVEGEEALKGSVDFLKENSDLKSEFPRAIYYWQSIYKRLRELQEQEARNVEQERPEQP